MTVNSDLIRYACIAHGTTLLAEFNSGDAELAALAAKCLEKVPPHHAAFTHTVRSRTYSFLIEQPFVYFAIIDERLEKAEGWAYLQSVRNSFAAVLHRELSGNCFPEELDPVFRRLIGQSGWRRIHCSEPVGSGSGSVRENESGIGGLSPKHAVVGQWKKQAWVVVSLELVICVVLFAAWACGFCQGLKWIGR